MMWLHSGEVFTESEATMLNDGCVKPGARSDERLESGNLGHGYGVTGVRGLKDRGRE